MSEQPIEQPTEPTEEQMKKLTERRAYEPLQDPKVGN